MWRLERGDEKTEMERENKEKTEKRQPKGKRDNDPVPSFSPAAKGAHAFLRSSQHPHDGEGLRGRPGPGPGLARRKHAKALHGPAHAPRPAPLCRPLAMARLCPQVRFHCPNAKKNR